MNRLDEDRLTGKQLAAYMNKEGFSDKEFANLLGVSVQAVWLWKSGERNIALTTSRLIKLFMVHPTLVRKFGRV